MSDQQQANFGIDGSVQIPDASKSRPPTSREIPPLADHFTSHDGIRGAAAIWIMLFHCVLYSKAGLNLQGSSLMPLFFLLSGYSLTVAYTDRSGGANTTLGNERSVGATGSERTLDNVEVGDMTQELRKPPRQLSFSSFYRNRLARVYPAYLFCALVALPLWFFGYGSSGDMGGIIASIITTVLPVNVFFAFLLGGPLDGPGWTVCTLLLLWLAFPWSLTRAQKMTDVQLLNWITILYFIQLALIFILYYSLVPVIGFSPGFAAATMHPFSRYPLFLMGIFAGELNARHWGRGPLPWSPSFFGLPVISSLFYNGKCRCEGSLLIVQPESTIEDARFWRSRADYMSGGLLVVTVIVAAADSIVKFLSGTSSVDIGGPVWLQAIVPYAQLEVIIALTRDEGQSLSAKALRTPFAAWFGKHSMSIYLIHQVLIFYLCWAVHGGSLTWPTEDCDKLTNPSPEYTACMDKWIAFLDARAMPYWGIPVIVAMGTCLGACITIFVEEPARKLFKK